MTMKNIQTELKTWSTANEKTFRSEKKVGLNEKTLA